MLEAREFYRTLLNLAHPWTVETVSFTAGAGRVDVTLGFDPGALFRCSRCHRSCAATGHAVLRSWRHLDSCGKKTYVLASLPMVSCAEHGSCEAHAPWAGFTQDFTSDFERLVICLAESSGESRKIARCMEIDPVIARRIAKRAKPVHSAETDPAVEAGIRKPAGSVPAKPRQLSLFQQDDMTFVNRGIAALKDLNVEKAVEYFERHRSIYPRGYDVAPPLGVAHFFLERLREPPTGASEGAGALCSIWDDFEARMAEGVLDRLPYLGELKGAFYASVLSEMESSGLADSTFLPGGLPVGRVYLQAGRIDAAIQSLQAAIADAPQRADLYGSLGDAYWLRGNVQVARQCYREACLIDPVGIDWNGLLDVDLQDLREDLVLEYGGDALLALQWIPSHARIEGLFEPKVVRLHEGLRELVNEYRSLQKSLVKEPHPFISARLFVRGMILCENDESLRFVKTIDLIEVRRTMKRINPDLFEEFLRKTLGE